jgi:hypothetical protein
LTINLLNPASSADIRHLSNCHFGGAKVKRQNFLAGTAASVSALAAAPASAQDGTTADVTVAVPERASIPGNFDHEYVERLVIAFSPTSIYAGERPALPMIDTTPSKENALPQDLWGLIYKGRKSSPAVRTVSITSPE